MEKKVHLMKNTKFKLNQIFALIILLAFGQGFAAMGSWRDHVSKKTPNNPTGECYEIETPDQLAWFAKNVAEGCAKLVADLDMKGEGEGYYWVPIAAGGTARAVNFDGNGHIIRNLYISAEKLLEKYPTQKYAQNLGLIGAFKGHVQNVILENVQVYAYGNNYSTTNTTDPVKGPLSIGTVVGWQSGGGKVENCYVTGTMLTIGDGQAVGGIVGNNGGGTISNCYSAVNITASGIAYVGGIAGYSKNYNGDVTISSCVYAGETLSAVGEGTVIINGKEEYFVSDAGAIVGNHYNGLTTFENVYYDSDMFDKGVGATMGGTTKGEPSGESELNSDLIACTLNGGEIQQDGSCSKEGAWSAGEDGLSLNGYGADGYKIVFDANGGSFAGGTTFVKYVKPGNVVNNEGVNDPTWGENHAFIGWALSADASESENLGNPSKDKVVYAVWNPVYTITFSAAPGKFISGDDEKTVKIERGKKISIGDAFGNPTRENYYFRGWAPNEDPSVEEALVDENTGLDALPDASENRTFYAVWTEVPTYIVTFHSNGHGPTVSKYLEVLENQTIEGLSEEQFGSAVGYVLDGWCHDSECKNVFNFSTTPITSDITVYAKWVKQSYLVNYVLNCDENCSATNASSYTVDGLALNVPNDWDGHHFVGWSEENNGADVKNSIPAGETGEKTLYAIWNVDAFTITYNAGAYGKGNLIPIVQMKYGESHTILGNQFTRDGFTQEGWSTSDGSKVAEYSVGQSISNVSLNLYPHWVLKNNTIAVKVVSAEFPYDGKEHAAECSVEGEVPEGFTISSSSSPTVLKVSDGKKTASCTLVIEDETGMDVTESFTIVSSKGSISVKAAETPIGALTILADENGKRAVINGTYAGNDETEITSNIVVNSVTLDRTFNAN
ncbi:InlB B-repeat-containing protein, partial [uncultured Fibrobacter sp.]|uniref:InlB B-repeat-containing protein n=1 Tax=uncultured Fibrobacter sp. TaxID=261512 RepID=UPI002637A97A